MRMIPSILALAACLLAALPAAPASAQDQPPRRPPTIAVTGTAEVQLKPDFARLFAVVGTTGDTVGQAADGNRAAT